MNRVKGSHVLAVLVSFLLVWTSMPWAFLAPVAAQGSNEAEEESAVSDGPVEKVEEIVEKRTSHTKTWRNSDLSETVEVHPTPIFYQEEDSDEWEPINNNITDKVKEKNERENFGFQNKANQFTVLFGKKANQQIFKMKEGSHWFRYSIVGAQPVKGEAKENEIVYPEIFPGVDAEYRVGAQGVKEDFVLHRKPEFTEITFDLKSNLDIREAGDVIEFVDPKNEAVVWIFEAPFMIDAKEKESYQSRFELIKEKNRTQLILHLDQAFLDDPDTKFPVKLDPTVTLGGSTSSTYDTYVQEAYPSYNYHNSPDLRTGYATEVKRTRSYVKFTSGLPDLNGGLLTNAKFKAYKYYEFPNTAVDTTIRIHRAYANWGHTSLNWSNQPSFGGAYASRTLPKGAANGWYDWNVTSLVQYWYENPTNFHGLVMQASNEGTNGSYRKFYASDYSTGGYSPRLEITYSPKPSAPTGTAVGNGSGTGTGYVNMSWNSVPGATGYKVLFFNGRVYDQIDVGNVTSWTTRGKKLWPTKAQIEAGEYRIRQDGTGTELADDPRPVYRISGGTTYNDRTNYLFRIIAYNAYGESMRSDTFRPTIDDQTPPTKPGRPTVSNNRTDRFTFTWPAASDTYSGVAKYRVYMGTAAGKTDIANGVEVTTNQYTHPEELDPRITYHAYVMAVDGGGNVSPKSDSGSGLARKTLDATLVSASIPSPMEASEDYEVSITLRNDGLETWTADKNIMLGSVNEEDPFTQEVRLPLSASDAIGTGQSKTFTLTFNGGTEVGLFQTRWRMLKVGTGWFGDTLTQDVAVLDTTPPDGAIQINGGQAFTNSRDVTLTLKANDNASGDIQQKLQNEDGPFSDYEPFKKHKAWRLSEGNGEKQVTVVYKDESGNESEPASDTIRLDTSYPTAALTSPEKLDYLSGTVEIRGSAMDSDLKDYVLAYGKGDAPTSWTTILTGDQPINGGILGNWNTSGLEAGKYTLRLAATDLAGNTTYAQETIWVDPPNHRLGVEEYWGTAGVAFGEVNLSNGNLTLGVADAVLDGRQLDPSIERNYNSQDTSPTLLGLGWRLNVESRIRVEPNGDVHYYDADGTVHRFEKQENDTYKAPVGVFVRLTRNGEGHYLLTDRDANSLSETYHEDGQLLSISDKNGNRIRFNYENGRLSEMVDDVNRSIRFTYNGEALLQEIQLYTGNRIQYEYDARRLLTQVRYVDPAGQPYRTLGYDYDEAKRLIEAVDPLGHAVTYTYNGSRVVEVAGLHTPRIAATGEKGGTVTVRETFNYDLGNNKVTLVTAGETLSHETVYRLNEHGNLVQTVTDPAGLNLKTTVSYQDNLVTETVDGKGYKTTYTYDEWGNLLTQTDPTFTDVEGETHTPVTRYEYQPGTSLLTKETDPLGRVTTYEYDTKGNRTQMVDSDGFKTTYQYDDHGNLLQETSERGPLYGYLPNFSFEEGEAAPENWKTSGSVTLDADQKKSGSRSVKLTGSATVESDYVSIKQGRLPVRGLAWVKRNEGTDVSGELTFYDSDKQKINHSPASIVTGSGNWQLLHGAASIPQEAAFVTFTIRGPPSGSVWVDDVWLEEANATERYVYDANGLELLKEVDPYGNETTYEYDAAGNKMAETNALNQRARFVYDADGKVIEEIDRLGKKSTFQYDASGNLVKESNPLKEAVEYEYDESGRQVLSREPKITKIFYEGQTPQEPEVVSIVEIEEYNELGLKVAERDGNGNVSTVAYDAAGRPTVTTDPLKNQRRLFYDANDNIVREEDWAYDTVTHTLYKKGTTHFQYDELNREIAFTDGSGDPDRIVQKSKYDAADNEIKVISGTGVTLEYRYDRNNDAIYTKENANPAVETWALHDGEGNLAISLDTQEATYHIHDLNGNLLQVVEGDGQTTTYTYNAVGDKRKQVDANGTETTWDYDGEGQIVKETVQIKDPDTQEMTYQITNYEYDDMGQVVKRTHQEKKGAETITSREVTLEYDERGRLIKETGLSEGKKTESRFYHDNNDNVTHTWIYDETVPVPLELDPDGDGVFNSETVSVYDFNNRLTQETISHTGTVTTQYFDDRENKEVLTNPLGDTEIQYDNSDRVQQVTAPNGDTYQYQYLVDHSLSRLTAPGMTTDYTYNGDGKAGTIRGKNRAGTTVVDLAYGYNDAEQIARISEHGQVTKRYGYTAAGYLETVEANGRKLKYTHDENGNIVKVENLTTGKTKETYKYATNNRIREKKEYNDTTGSLIRTTQYQFNAEGALQQATTSEGGNTTVVDYVYNNDDQLVTVKRTVNGQVEKTIVYGYDPDGNRLSKTVDGKQQLYHRDTSGEIFAIAQETDAGPESVLQFHRDEEGNLLSFRYDGQHYYYQFNARGDVIALTDAAGNLVARYDYDEWGNVIDIQGNTDVAEANPYRYVGQYGVMHDADAGLYLMGWRDYDPTTGRFIVPDEYEGDEEDPTTLNRYLYAEGDPVNNIDPDGYIAKWIKKGKKVAKKAYNFAIGDDINTLRNPKSKWYHKAGATISIASNFVPGAGAVKWGAKAAYKAGKYAVKTSKSGKKIKKSKKKLSHKSVKKTRKAKLKKKKGSKKTVSKRSYKKASYSKKTRTPKKRAVKKATPAKAKRTAPKVSLRKSSAPKKNYMRSVHSGPGGKAKQGEFSISDWSDYPGEKKPKGPFRLLEGQEYKNARKAANNANRKIHRKDPRAKGKEIHEVHPVKFGGSPTDSANKIYLDPAEHRKYTTWWNRIQRKMNKR